MTRRYHRARCRSSIGRKESTSSVRYADNDDLFWLNRQVAMPRRGLQALLPDRRFVLFAGSATSRKKLVGSSVYRGRHLLRRRRGYLPGDPRRRASQISCKPPRTVASWRALFEMRATEAPQIQASSSRSSSWLRKRNDPSQHMRNGIEQVIALLAPRKPHIAAVGSFSCCPCPRPCPRACRQFRSTTALIPHRFPCLMSVLMSGQVFGGVSVICQVARYTICPSQPTCITATRAQHRNATCSRALRNAQSPSRDACLPRRGPPAPCLRPSRPPRRTRGARRLQAQSPLSRLRPCLPCAA